MHRWTVCAYSLLLASTAICHAAQPVGSMACSGAPSTLSFNVSYFDLGVSNASAAGSAGSGAGAGKASFSLQVHAALSTFTGLLLLASDGGHFSSCTLTTQASSGDTIQFRFRNIGVQSVNAIASSAVDHSPRYAYTDAAFDYESIEVITSSAVDDGGAGPAGNTVAGQ